MGFPGGGKFVGMLGAEMTKAEIKAELRQLPLAERVAFLEELWREAEQDQPRLLDWQKKIVDERLADLEARPEDWISVEELRERLERRLQGVT